MSFATVGTVVGAGSAAYSVYNSVRKNAAAKQLARQNIRPVFNADGSIREVYDLSRSELDNTYADDYARRQLDQNTMSGIDAVLKSGGRLDFETAHNRYGSQLQAQLNQIMLARDRKIAAFNNAAYNQAASKDSEFQYNLDAPYKDRQQLQAQLMQESAASAKDAQNALISTASNAGISRLLEAQRRRDNWQGPTERVPYRPTTIPMGGSSRADQRFPALWPSAGAREAAMMRGFPVTAAPGSSLQENMISPESLELYRAYGIPQSSADYWGWNLNPSEILR